jgi:hypothetical protein
MFCAKLLTCLLVCMCVLCAVPASALDDEMHAHHHEAGEQLGKVSFPVSCAPASQKAFERGVALLHSFGYEEAEEQFVEISQQDTACAMAHWGIAMSLFHEIWERPQESTLKRGHEEIEKAQKIGAKTERERGYISALAVFYRDPATSDYLTRAAAYSDAMAKLYQQYPTDLEAGAFYALSLLAAARPDDTSLASAKKAVAVLTRCSCSSPIIRDWRTTSFIPAIHLRWRPWDSTPPVAMRTLPLRHPTPSTCHRTFLPGWGCGRRTSRRT